MRGCFGVGWATGHGGCEWPNGCVSLAVRHGRLWLIGSVCAEWDGKGKEGRGAVLTSLSRVIFHGAIRNAVRVRPCCRPRPT